MVKGLDIFRERFREFGDVLILIGGAACDEWFSREGLTFRVTRDLDIVLVLEAVSRRFVAAMRQFVEDGGYKVRQRTETGSPILYRFAKPTHDHYPHMLELFSRKPDDVDLNEGQWIAPIPVGAEGHSLSAILLQDDYYQLIREHQDRRDGLAFANATALIPLKARAWLDLTERSRNGENVDTKDIGKHRTDVFRLAGTLPGTPGPELPELIRADIVAFLDAFREDSPEWTAILASLKNTLGAGLRPAALRSAIQTYFRLT
jgi:hypothetical protein